jgi:hypothetical protein
MLLLACRPAPPSPAVVTSTSPIIETNPEEIVQHFASPAYGVQAFLWWQPRIDQWHSGGIPAELATIRDMGFGWVKQQFAWRDIEGIEKGRFDWWRPDQIVAAAENASLQLVARLDRQPVWSQEPGSPLKENRPPADLSDFADFCGEIASRYQGRIAAYQIWNEPNLGREWGDETPSPKEYTALLRVCYEAIKSADPAAIVISAGLAPTGTHSSTVIPDAIFLQQMYDEDAAPYFDVLGVNAPGYKAAPETSPDEVAVSEEYGNGRWFAFRHVEDMREIMIANGDAKKQIAILEMGWTLDQVNPEYAWFAVDEQTQADYLVRAYQYAAANWRPWIGLMTTVYIAAPDWTPDQHEQWWWSIVLPDGTPRLAYQALREMEKSGGFN